MTDAKMGRPPEDAGPHHYSAPEAARIIGRSAETIRTWIKNGRLEGDQYMPQGSTTQHYRATRESVHREAERLGSTATPRDVDLTVEYARTEAVEQIITQFREIFSESDERVIQAMEEFCQGIKSAVENQESEVSKRLDEMKEIQKETLALFTRLEQTEAARRERGLRERRSFWRRLFG